MTFEPFVNTLHGINVMFKKKVHDEPSPVPLTKLLTLFGRLWDQSNLQDSDVFPEDQGKCR